MSSTRIGKQEELHLYINHKRFDWDTIRLEIIEPITSLSQDYLATDMDNFLNLFELFAGEVKLKSEAKNLTEKIKRRMLKKHDDWPESSLPPHCKI